MGNSEKADEYLEKGEIKAALKFYIDAVNQDPNDSLAYYGIAECQYRLGLYTDAIGAANKAIELNPESAEPHTTLAWINYFGIHDSAAGITEAARAYEMNPNLFETAFCYGSILVREARPQEGIPLLQQAAKINPRSPNPHINLSIAYLDQNDIKGNFEESLVILKLKPSFKNGVLLLYAFERRYKSPLIILTTASVLIPLIFRVKAFLAFLAIPLLTSVWALWKGIQAAQQRDWKVVTKLFVGTVIIAGCLYVVVRFVLH